MAVQLVDSWVSYDPYEHLVHLCGQCHGYGWFWKSQDNLHMRYGDSQEFDFEGDSFWHHISCFSCDGTGMLAVYPPPGSSLSHELVAQTHTYQPDKRLNRQICGRGEMYYLHQGDMHYPRPQGDE